MKILVVQNLCNYQICTCSYFYEYKQNAKKFQRCIQRSHFAPLYLILLKQVFSCLLPIGNLTLRYEATKWREVLYIVPIISSLIETWQTILCLDEVQSNSIKSIQIPTCAQFSVEYRWRWMFDKEMWKKLNAKIFLVEYYEYIIFERSNNCENILNGILLVHNFWTI